MYSLNFCYVPGNFVFRESWLVRVRVEVRDERLCFCCGVARWGRLRPKMVICLFLVRIISFFLWTGWGELRQWRWEDEMAFVVEVGFGSWVNGR